MASGGFVLAGGRLTGAIYRVKFGASSFYEGDAMVSENEKMIRCRTIECEYVSVPASSVTIRVGVYGLIGRGTKLLLINFPHLRQYTLPGGGVKPQETLGEALVREFEEEVGVRVTVRELVHVAQEFFLHPHTGKAHNCLSHFYECLLEDEPLIGVRADRPDFPDAFAEWVDVSSPDEAALHPFIRKPVEIWLGSHLSAAVVPHQKTPWHRRPIYYR